MDLLQRLNEAENTSELEGKTEFIQGIVREVETAGYTVAELNDEKPWGGYIRIGNEQADQFIEEFFPGLSLEEARLGTGAEVSPKLLIVTPNQRLSWQYHHRRAERWTFLTPGAFYQSETDEQGEITEVEAGESVQFGQGDRHRLIGGKDGYTVVAEIWQHTDPQNPSNEDDIVRLQDDYQRQ